MEMIDLFAFFWLDFYNKFVFFPRYLDFSLSTVGNRGSRIASVLSLIRTAPHSARCHRRW